MFHRRVALITAGTLGTALITMGAATPNAASEAANEGPTAVTLSAVATEDHSDRIATIANDLNDAYLVTPGQQVEPEVVELGDTPAEAAAALADATDLNPVAEDQVSDEAELHENERDSMAKVHTTVLKSTSSVQDITAVQNADGTKTLTARVYTKNEMGGDWVWQEITPYVVTVDPATNEYTSLDVQYNMGGEGSGATATQKASTSEPATSPTLKSAAIGGSVVPAESIQSTAAIPELKMSASGKAAAVRYAEYWWNKRNPAYRDFTDNDCTNFVSQALLAGGWAQNTDFTTFNNGQPVAWFYRNGDRQSNGYSLSWSVADNFYLTNVYALNRIYNTQDRYALREGDVLQWKLPDHGGKMNHTTLVTGYTTEPHLTYHSGNNIDLPMSVAASRLAEKYPQGGIMWYPMAVR